VAGVRREKAGRTSPENDPGSHDVIELDGDDPDTVARAVAGLVERHGSLDILINAAGSMPSQALARPGPGNKQPDDKQKSDKHGDGTDSSGDGTKPDGEASDKKPMPRGKKMRKTNQGKGPINRIITC
jgi:NAD(P)-dependent dehydrogenase (short-subunit alcohol dehydrogenase family)